MAGPSGFSFGMWGAKGIAMEGVRIKRGAWRRNPALPRALTTKKGATVTATPPWAESIQPEVRHLPEARSSGIPPLPEPEPDPGPVPQPVPGEDEPKPSEALRLGGCLCGSVRYEVRGQPMLVGLCHCADCRKATGGHALHHADWPVSAVTITGRLGTHAGRSFCPGCGSRVAHFTPHHTEILLGTLDDPPTDLVPQMETWTIRRESWVQPVPGARQFERDPE